MIGKALLPFTSDERMKICLYKIDECCIVKATLLSLYVRKVQESHQNDNKDLPRFRIVKKSYGLIGVEQKGIFIIPYFYFCHIFIYEI